MNGQLTEKQVFGPAWYCARTQPKHEHIAAGNLSARLGLEVFNPRLRMERATRRGVVRIVEPLFPCYIFVRCILEECVDEVRYAYGISTLVHFGRRIPPVPDEVVQDLRQCFDSDQPMAVEDRLQIGSEVTVSAGAFLGSRGVVLRVLPARQRVQILLDFLGRTTMAEVDRETLSVEGRSMADLLPALVATPRTNIAIASAA